MRGERSRGVFSTQVTVEGELSHLSGLGDWSILTAPAFGTTGGNQVLPPLPAVFNSMLYSPILHARLGSSVFYGQIFDRARGFTVESCHAKKKGKNCSVPLRDTVLKSMLGC